MRWGCSTCAAVLSCARKSHPDAHQAEGGKVCARMREIRTRPPFYRHQQPHTAGRLNLLRLLQELSTVLRSKRLGFLHELLLLVLIKLGRRGGARRHGNAHLLEELLLP